MWKWISITAAISAMTISAASADHGAIRISPVADSQLLHQVQPAYPPDARDAHIQGTVRINLVIGKDGHIEQARVLSGNRLLAPAALQAVRQRIYKPFESGGKPVRVITEVDIPFVLP